MKRPDFKPPASWFRRIFLLAALGLVGCASTQITSHRLSDPPIRPYRMVLACSMDTDDYRRGVVESAVREALGKHSIASETCTNWFGDVRSLPEAQMLSSVPQGGFDAVLGWHRRPIIHIANGPGRRQARPVTLAGFLQAYRNRILTNPQEAVVSEEGAEMPIQEGAEKVVEGEVHLLDVRSGQCVWQATGAVLEVSDAPLQDAARKLADSVVHALLQDGVIP